jgi:hypothetical protein
MLFQNLLQRVINLNAQGLNSTEISKLIHKSHTYTAKLHRIVRYVHPLVLLQWRMMVRPLSTEAMTHIAKLPVADQENAFVSKTKRWYRSRAKMPLDEMMRRVGEAHAAIYAGKYVPEVEICHCQNVALTDEEPKRESA